MREYLTADDHFSEIVMQRTADKRSILVVEGPSDLGLLSPFVSDQDADVKEFGGKVAALNVIKICNSNLVQRVIALVDSDFDWIAAKSPETSNVVYTDGYDMEATLFRAGDVLDRFVSNHFDRDSLPGGQSSSVELIRKIVETLASQIGYIRFVASRNSLPVALSKVPVEAVLDYRQNTLDIEKLIKVSLIKSGQPPESIDEFVHRIKKLTRELDVADPFIYCRGHDLVKILAALGRKKWGSSTAADQAERALRSSVDFASLMTTNFFRDIADWSDLNKTTIWNAA